MFKFVLPLIAGVAASSAGAAIVSVAGSTQLIAAPPSVASGVLTSQNFTYAFNERTNVNYSGQVDVQNPVPGFVFDITNVPGGFVNAEVDSHLIHFDVTDINSDTILNGVVVFDQPILAVIIDGAKLSNSDAALGAPGTAYPFGVANRGFSGTQDWFRLTAPDTLEFRVRNINTADQIRVLTRSVPTPGVAAVLGIGFLAGSRRRR